MISPLTPNETPMGVPNETPMGVPNETPMGVLEKKAKCLINFEVLSDVRDISVLVKDVGFDLVRLLNTAFLDAHLSQVQRFEYVCQSILVALDDAEKVGTRLMEESIVTKKTKDALKKIQEARNFVKNQLPQMLHLSLSVSEALADGRIEIREIVEVVEAAKKVNWLNAFAACFGFCFQKKGVAAVAVLSAVPPLHVAAAAAAPESPIPEPPLTPPQGEPEPLEVPAPLQSSDAPAAPETKPENV